MASKELKNLTRQELLEMLLDEAKENQRLQQEIDDLTAKLERKELDMNELGSVAEATLKLNGVMEAADRAAEQYILNARMKADEIVSNANAEAEKIIEDSRKEAEDYCRDAVKKLMKALPEQYSDFRKAIGKLEQKDQ